MFKSIQEVKDRFAEVGYVMTSTLAADVFCFTSVSIGVRGAILHGKPGVGKTFLGESMAKVLGAEYIYRLGHAWLTDQDILQGLDIPALAAGVKDKEEAVMAGTLVKAARASQRGPAVLVFDELDKVPEKVEGLFLEFLQTGQVTVDDHILAEGNLDQLIVIITSNSQRELMSPTERRLANVRMTFLPPRVEVPLIIEKSGAPNKLAELLVKLAWILRNEVEKPPCLEELMRAAAALMGLKDAPDFLLRPIMMFMIKENEDWNLLKKQAGFNIADVLAREVARADAPA